MTQAVLATPDLRAGTALHRLVRGFGFPFRGLAFMFRHPALWTFALVPMLISLLLLTGIFVALVYWADDLTVLLWARPEPWYWQIPWWLLYALVFAVSFVVSAVALPGLIASPFNDALSERTEKLLLGRVRDEKLTVGGVLRGLGRTLLDEVLKIALLLAGHLLILPLLLVPVAGAIVYPVLAATWTMLWLSAEYLEYPMSRNGLGFSAVRGAVRANLVLCLGFGGAVSLILMVPLLNVLFVPVAVVGGTLMYGGLLEAGAVPPRPVRGAAHKV